MYREHVAVSFATFNQQEDIFFAETVRGMFESYRIAAIDLTGVQLLQASVALPTGRWTSAVHGIPVLKW